MTAKNLTTVLNALNTSSTKAEEIEALQMIRAAIQPGTYLASLFTEALVMWAAGQITNDFPPDVFDHLQCERQESARTIAKLNEQLGSAERELERVQNHLQTTIIERDRVAADLVAAREAHAKTRQIAQDADSNWREMVEEATETNERLEAEVVRLKVMIFDLEHPRNGSRP